MQSALTPLNNSFKINIFNSIYNELRPELYIENFNDINQLRSIVEKVSARIFTNNRSDVDEPVLVSETLKALRDFIERKHKQRILKKYLLSYINRLTKLSLNKMPLWIQNLKLLSRNGERELTYSDINEKTWVKAHESLLKQNIWVWLGKLLTKK